MQISSSSRKAPQSRGVSASLRKLALRRGMQALAVGALLALPLTSQAAALSWDPGITNGTALGGNGTWDTTTTNWFNGTNVVWPNTTANTSTFGGAAGTVTLGSAITTGGLTFNAAGYTIAAAANTLSIGTGGITTADSGTGTTTITGTVASVGAQTWTIGTGDTLQFNAAFTSPTAANGLTISSAGTTNIASAFTVAGKSTFAGGGIVNLSGTESFETSAGDYTGIQGVTLNNKAGAATFNPGTANSFYIGSTGSATQPSVLNVTGGTVSVTSATRIFIGDAYNGTAVAGDGTLSVGGGSGAAVFTTGTTANASNFLGNSVATGTINLLANGTMSTNRNYAAGATGKGFVNFNGGTFQATGTAAALASTLTTTIAEGGATIDPQTFAITIASGIGHGGTAATDGGLTLAAGTGTTNLTGVLSFTGGLTANSGGAIRGNNTYAGATNLNAFVDVYNGNAFGATGTGNGTNINSGGTVRYRDQTNSTLAEAFTLNSGSAFLLYNNPGTTTVSGGFILNASSTLQFQPQAQTNTTANITGAITDGTTTGNNLTLTRNGNITHTSNDVVNLSAANTYGGSTTISDAVTPTPSTLSPGTFSVNLIGGDNRLPTTTAVTLTNAQLTLGSTTAASNQTLTGLTGSGTNAAVVGGYTSASTLTLAVAGTDTYAGKLGGTGTNQNNLALALTGPGTVTLTGANSYSGGTTVNKGTLSLGATAADGTGALVVNTGGTTTVTANNALGGGNVTLAGGTLQNGNTTGTNLTNMQTSGALSLASGTASTLDFGAANLGAVFTFTGFDAANTGSLSIINYLGTPNVGNGLDQLFIAGTPLTASQLGQIIFKTGGTTFAATQLASGEVVENVLAATPEPSQYAAFGIGLLGLGALALRAKKRSMSA